VTHLTHLPPWTLEELAEDMLSPGETALALEHVRSCARCAADLEASRQMVAALSSLPRFDPSPSFADAVMARVPLPMVEPLGAKVRRWLPKTKRGWMGMGAAVLVPLAPVVTLLAWLFSHPGVTPGSLWGVSSRWAGESAWRALVAATEWVVRSPAFEWMVTTGSETVGGTQGLSVLALAFLVSVPLSGWALVRLLRTPVGGMTHAR
jgi:hypothetical protein